METVKVWERIGGVPSGLHLNTLVLLPSLRPNFESPRSFVHPGEERGPCCLCVGGMPNKDFEELFPYSRSAQIGARA